MVKKRIIPKFLLRTGQLFKGVRFQENIRVAGNPVTTAQVYESYGVDEMLFLDTEASVEGRQSLIHVVEAVAEQVFMPLTVGGGVRTLADVNDLLRAGADKVSVTTAAVEIENFICEAGRRFGDQCMTVGIDYREVAPGIRRVFTHGGRQVTELDPLEFAMRMQDSHCGEIVLCSIDRDGTMRGYDIEMLQKASELLKLPIVASCGAGNLDHCLAAFGAGASAITVSTMFLFTDNSPIKVRSYLCSKGLHVRASSSSRN
jgi:cyclase